MTRALLFIALACYTTTLQAQTGTQACSDIDAATTSLREATAFLRAQSTASTASFNQRTASSQDIEQAKRRLALMECLAIANPGAVAHFSLQNEDRGRLASAGFPVETVTTVESEVSIFVRDFFEEGRAVNEVHMADGGVAYSSDAVTGDLACGDVARLRVLQVGSKRVVTRAELISRRATNGCSTLGEQKVAVILVHSKGTQPPVAGTEFWQQRLFAPGAGSLADFVQASSYGQTSVQGNVFGWYETSRPYACEDLGEVRDLALEAASGDIDFSAYTRIMLIVAAEEDESCGAGGFGQLGCQVQDTPQGEQNLSVAWLFLRDRDSPAPESPAMSSLIHEFGHNLGLHHARSLDFEDDVLGVSAASGVRTEYADQYSMMGGKGDFSARHKEFLGWLQEGSGILTPFGAGTFDLSRLQSGGPHPRALRVARRPFSAEFLWLEARSLTPWERQPDAIAFEDVRNGIFLRYQDAADGASERYTDRLTTDLVRENPRFLKPKLKAGEFWRDAHGPLRIEVLSQTEDVTRVKIEYETLCSTVAIPGNTVPGEGGVFAVSVNADAGCTWNALADAPFVEREGLAERSGSGVVNFHFGANSEPTERSAIITVGRQVFTITQAGLPDAPSVEGLSLLTLGVGFDSPAGFDVQLRDANGAQNLETLEMRIGPSRERPICVATVDFRQQIVQVFGFDNQTPVGSFPLSNPSDILGSFCSFGLLGWNDAAFAANLPELSMSFRMTPLPIAAAVHSMAAAFYLRVRDRDGNTTDWKRFQPFSIGDECIVRTPGSRLVLDTTARTIDWRVTAPEGCLWAAHTENDRVTFDPEWKIGTQLLAVSVEAVEGLIPPHPVEIGNRDKEIVRIPVEAAPPVVPSAESIVHGARFQPPVAGGSWFSIFGSNFALTPRDWQGDDFHSYVLPPGLEGVEVLVNDEPVAVSFAGPGQLNALMPGKHGEGLVRLRVRTPFGESAEHLVPVGLFVPGLFFHESGGAKLAAAHHVDGARVGPFEEVEGVVVSRPAKPGDIISVYGTGFGPTNPSVDDSVLFQGAAPLVEELPASVSIGGQPADIEFIGKSATGLYQMNVVVLEAAPGNQPIILKVATVISQADIVVPIAP